MKIEKLIEARRNPAQNKKVGLLQSLKEFANTLDKLPNGKVNGFISFSFLVKLGINLKPLDVATPSGIYGYPIDYVITLLEQKGTDSPKVAGLPYAGDRPYIHVFSIKNPEKVLFLEKGTLVDSALEQKIIALLDSNPHYMQIAERFNVQKQHFSTKGTYWILQKSIEKVYNNQDGSRTMTKIMKQLGYEGIYDDGHNQIAYEPYQVVMFSKFFVEQHDMLINNHTDLQHTQKASYGGKVGATFIHNVTKDSLPSKEFIQLLKSSRLRYVLREKGMEEYMDVLDHAKTTQDLVNFLQELNDTNEDDVSFIGKQVFLRSFASRVCTNYYLETPSTPASILEWDSVFYTWVRNSISICRLVKNAAEMPNFKVSDEIKQYIDAKLSKFLKVYDVMRKLNHLISSPICKKIIVKLHDMDSAETREASNILYGKIAELGEDEFFDSISKHTISSILTNTQMELFSNARNVDRINASSNLAPFDSFRYHLFVEICRSINEFIDDV